MRAAPLPAHDHILVADESIGHAPVFVFDDEFWSIQYMTVDTETDCRLPGASKTELRRLR
jgi:hypothetical protein